MKVAIVLLFILPSIVLCFSSGEGIFNCDARSSNWGCDPARWDRGRRLECLDKSTRLMSWATWPTQNSDYELQFGPVDQPSTQYTPNEWLDVRVITKKVDGQFRGILLYAADSQGSKVGEWQFAQDLPESWQHPASCPNSLLHATADLKPFVLRASLKLPPGVAQPVTIRCLLKAGVANEGDFYWPGLVDPQLTEGAAASAQDPVWIRSSVGESCAAACSAKGMTCVSTPQALATFDDANPLFRCNPTTAGACSALAPAFSSSDQCYSRLNNCAEQQQQDLPFDCAAAPSSEIGRFCPCSVPAGGLLPTPPPSPPATSAPSTQATGAPSPPTGSSPTPTPQPTSAPTPTGNAPTAQPEATGAPSPMNSCTVGTKGCPCTNLGACTEPGTECAGSSCVVSSSPPECTPGQLGCPCMGDQSSCTGLATCDTASNLCVPLSEQSCTEGTVGCFCRSAQPRCNGALFCIESYCLAGDTAPDSNSNSTECMSDDLRGCPCDWNDPQSCGGAAGSDVALRCELPPEGIEQARCVFASCPLGTLGCPCVDGSSCATGLLCNEQQVCAQSTAQQCAPGSRGCPCDLSSGCSSGDLACVVISQSVGQFCLDLASQQQLPGDIDPDGTNWLVVGLAVGGGVLLLLVLIQMAWFFSRRSRKESGFPIAMAPPIVHNPPNTGRSAHGSRRHSMRRSRQLQHRSAAAEPPPPPSYSFPTSWEHRR